MGLRLAWAVVACAVLAGCVSREVRRESELRQRILEDQRFSVDAIPPDASAQTAASLRMAAQGHHAMGEGRLEEAEDRLERALSVDSANPFCYYYLAEIRFEEGRLEQALILLRQSEVLFQGHPYWLSEVHAREGKCWEMLGSSEEAEASFRQALEHNPWNETARKGIQEP